MSEIVSTEDTLHGKPRIKGTRIPVRTVYALYDEEELEPDEIAGRYPGIDEEDVKVAIRYREDKKEES